MKTDLVYPFSRLISIWVTLSSALLLATDLPVHEFDECAREKQTLITRRSRFF
jgi:hypothetical protein